LRAAPSSRALRRLGADELAISRAAGHQRGVCAALDEAYDYDPGSNVVEVYVGYLRRRFGTR
jgi:hypothetical protein